MDLDILGGCGPPSPSCDRSLVWTLLHRRAASRGSENRSACRVARHPEGGGSLQHVNVTRICHFPAGFTPRCPGRALTFPQGTQGSLNVKELWSDNGLSMWKRSGPRRAKRQPTRGFCAGVVVSVSCCKNVTKNNHVFSLQIPATTKVLPFIPFIPFIHMMIMCAMCGCHSSVGFSGEFKPLKAVGGPTFQLTTWTTDHMTH